MSTMLDEQESLKSLLAEKEQTILSLTEEKAAAEKEAEISEANRKQRVMEDRMNRKDVLEGLLSPLANEKRRVMSDLLESVKTSNLKTAFKKYLPAVLNENVTAKAETKTTLTEGKVTEHTGDRESTTETQSTGGDADIVVLKKLAGL